ncbi:MAG: hypothetical protein E7663_02040 [Ruminococcaceae bacterium]|nr:hypothetical protein [Oscillospiraceae bacterium]
MLIPMIASCGKKDDEPPREPETYYTSLAVKYSPNGEYSGTLTFDETVDDSFADLSADNFTLTAYNYVGESEVSAELNDFSVTKTDDKNIKFSFKSPFGYDENIQYVLLSESVVTEKDAKIAALVYVYVPEPELDFDFVGAYRGTDKVTLTATLTDGWAFNQNITANMLSFPEGFDVSVEVVRESDTKVIFTVTNIPEAYTGVVIPAVLSKDAIDSEFSTADIALAIDYFQPSLTIESSSVSFDEATNTYTVGKVTLPEGVQGVQNGISVSSSLYSVLEQSYDEAARTYSFKLLINDSELVAEAPVTELLPFINVTAILKTEKDEIKYSFYPYNALAGVKGEVITDEENGKLYIELTPYNATFADGFTADDVTISDAEGLTNFAVSSVSADKLVYVADYTEAQTLGVALSFEIQGDSLNTSFGLARYSLMLYVPCYSDGRDLDWAELGGKLASSAAGGLGGAIGSSVAGFVLPYVYDFLGVDTSDPELNAIRESITSLTYAINDLTNDVGNVVDYIEAGTNRTILDNFQTLETSMLTSSLKLLSDEAVISYVSYLTNNFKDAIPDYKESMQGKKDFERFLQYFNSMVPKSPYSQEVLIHHYNSWRAAAVKVGYDYFYRTTQYSFVFSHYSGSTKQAGTMDPDTVYNMLVESHEYVSYEIPSLDIERNENFEKAVEKLNYNNAYINNVVNYGNRILGNASGTSNGIIELFFQVVDTMYNFESQTITAKKAFVSKVQSVYLLNTAIALQYCDSIGDTGNATLIRSYIEKVLDKIDTSFKLIDEMEARAAKGNDKLLVSGQVVSKEMKAKTATKGTKSSTRDLSGTFLSVSEQTYRTMMQRAKVRGLSLAKDLKAAGFTNVTADEGVRYVYVTKSTEYSDTVTRLDAFGNALKFWIYTDDNPEGEVRVTTVEQNGDGEPMVTHDNVLTVEYMHNPSVWSSLFGSAKAEYYSMPNYNAIIGFSAEKK